MTATCSQAKTMAWAQNQEQHKTWRSRKEGEVALPTPQFGNLSRAPPNLWQFAVAVSGHPCRVLGTICDQETPGLALAPYCPWCPQPVSTTKETLWQGVACDAWATSSPAVSQSEMTVTAWSAGLTPRLQGDQMRGDRGT